MKEKIEEVKNIIYPAGELLYKTIEKSEYGYSYGDIYNLIRKKINEYKENISIITIDPKSESIMLEKLEGMEQIVDKILYGIEYELEKNNILINKDDCKMAELSLDDAYKGLADIQNETEKQEEEKNKLLNEIENNENK
jgi:hypothetical protein